MRRDEVEPLALLRLGYGGYRLSRLARAEMQFEASLTAAMASAMRRARCVDGEWADTCGLRWSGKALMQKCSRWVKSTRQEVSEFQMLQSSTCECDCFSFPDLLVFKASHGVASGTSGP
jgi:hypothetical protein